MKLVLTPDLPISNGIDLKFNKIKFLLMAFLCLLNLFLNHAVFAQGVAAGTSIFNTAIVNYKIDNLNQAPIESSPEGNINPGLGSGEATIFVVDRKIDLLVTGNSNANVNPGDTQAEVTFILKNEGNDTQEFGLIPDTTLTNDDFDTKNCNVIVTSLTGSPLPGITLPVTGDIKLKADQEASISVKCDIPFDNQGLPILSGQSALITLYAIAEKNADGTITSETNTNETAMGIETVFADSTGTDDIERDATHSARRTFTASSSTIKPELTMEKTIVKVQDPNGGSDAISGSEVTYKISINTSGTGFIDNLVITDPVPAEMSYKPASIHLNNTKLSDNDDSDKADFGVSNSNTATIKLGSIPAGSLHEIELTYIIN